MQYIDPRSVFYHAPCIFVMTLEFERIKWVWNQTNTVGDARNNSDSSKRARVIAPWMLLKCIFTVIHFFNEDYLQSNAVIIVLHLENVAG